MQDHIKLRLPGGSQISIAVYPSMLVNDLLQIASESTQSANGVYLLSGFPPQKRVYTGGPHSGELLVDALFKAGETVTVQLLLRSSPTPPSPPTSPTLAIAPPSQSPVRDRHERASKTKAAEHITAEIEAEKEREKKREAAERKRKAGASDVKYTSSLAKKPKLDFGPGEGHRLGSEPSPPQPIHSPELNTRESVPTAPVAPARSPASSTSQIRPSDHKSSPIRRQRINLASSEQGVAEKLVSALGAGGGTKDGASEYLQKVAQSALNQQYDIANAGDRVTAAMAGLYSFEPISSGGRSLASGDCTELRVRYKPAQKKKFVEEVVDNLPLTALAPLFEMLVKGEGSSEATRSSLRPHEMARLSTRTFWAVIRYGGPLFRNEPPPGLNDTTVSGVPTMPGRCLEAICPSIDWSFLEERSKRLSEKALKNAQANPQKLVKKSSPSAAPVIIGDSLQESSTSSLSSSFHPLSSSILAPDIRRSVDIDDGEIHYSEPAHATLESLALSSMVDRNCLHAESYEDSSLSKTVSETLARLQLSFTGSFTLTSKQPLPSNSSSSASASVLPSDEIYNIDSLLNRQIKSPEISLVPNHEPYRGHRVFDARTNNLSLDIETFICDLCSKARILCSEEEDLTRIRDAERWTCKDAKPHGRLHRRGLCRAPDDDLCEILGSEDAAACCDEMKLSSVMDVASALMVPLDELLFDGKVGPLTSTFLKSRCTFLPAVSSSSSSSSLSLPQPLKASMVDDFIEIASTLGILSEEGAVTEQDSFVDPPVSVFQWRRILGQRLPQHRVLLSYMSLDASDRRSRMSSMRGLHIGKYGIKLSLQEYRARGNLLLLAAAQHIIPRDSRGSSFDDAASLLFHPLGLVAAYSVAQSWQAFARADAMAELLASVIEGGEGDQVDSDSVIETLTELRIQTPADLAMIDTGVLFSTLKSRGEAYESLHQSTVDQWKKNVKSLIAKQPWLAEILTEA